MNVTAGEAADVHVSPAGSSSQKTHPKPCALQALTRSVGILGPVSSTACQERQPPNGGHLECRKGL